MRLESALSASRAGLDSHGKAISVIGDNVANSNTVGYKASRVEFADLLPQGENATASSIPYTGAGVTVARVRQIYEGGYLEDTGRALDAAVDGNGFFMVTDASGTYLTRAGNFQISADGFLVNAEGKQVQGFSGSSTTLGPIDMVHVNVGGAATTTAQITGNLNSTSATVQPPASPQTFAELQKAASFSSTLDVFDSLGVSHGVSLYWFKTGTNAWTVQSYVDGGAVGGTAGVPKQIGATNLTFDTSGNITGAASMTMSTTFTGAAPSSIAVDLTKMTQMGSGSQISNITRNGQAGGGVQEYEIKDNGEIYAQLDSGTNVKVGTIQLAMVPNTDGLARAGNTLFKETAASGTRTTGQPGSGSFGALRGQSLEHSTVDISQEFVNLVVMQRGYQANSQVLSATNQLLRDTLSLIR